MIFIFVLTFNRLIISSDLFLSWQKSVSWCFFKYDRMRSSIITFMWFSCSWSTLSLPDSGSSSFLSTSKKSLARDGSSSFKSYLIFIFSMITCMLLSNYGIYIPYIPAGFKHNLFISFICNIFLYFIKCIHSNIYIQGLPCSFQCRNRIRLFCIIFF